MNRKNFVARSGECSVTLSEGLFPARLIESENGMFIVSKKALQVAIARLLEREQKSAGHFNEAEIAAGAALEGMKQPQEYADTLVRLNQNLVEYRKTLEAVLEMDPRATEFRVPNEAEFLAGREIVETADELGTQFEVPQWVQ